MKSLQGTFTRLKKRLDSDKIQRGRLLVGITLIHNFRIEIVGLNQISTVFDEHYEQIINIAGYERIARYFPNQFNFDD